LESWEVGELKSWGVGELGDPRRLVLTPRPAEIPLEKTVVDTIEWFVTLGAVHK
jgi:hypothetical protein